MIAKPSVLTTGNLMSKGINGENYAYGSEYLGYLGSDWETGKAPNETLPAEQWDTMMNQQVRNNREFVFVLNSIYDELKNIIDWTKGTGDNKELINKLSGKIDEAVSGQEYVTLSGTYEDDSTFSIKVVIHA